MRLVLAVVCLLGLAWPGARAAELSVPTLTGRVVDRAGMLDDAGETHIEQAIQELERITGGQMAVLTVRTLGDDALELFSMRVAEAWKIGRRGQDDGALLVVVRDDRLMRLEVGLGWEGQINDARAGDIIRGMAPFFRAGSFADGVTYAVEQVQTFVSGQAPVDPVQPPPMDPRVPGTAFLIILLIIIVLNVLQARYGRRGYVVGGGGYSARGGGFGGGGFSGGGGGFGGGGASGSW